MTLRERWAQLVQGDRSEQGPEGEACRCACHADPLSFHAAYGRCKSPQGFRCRDGSLVPKEEATTESVTKLKRLLAPHHRAQYMDWVESGGDSYQIEKGGRR